MSPLENHLVFTFLQLHMLGNKTSTRQPFFLMRASPLLHTFVSHIWMRMTLNFKGVQVYLHNQKRHLEIILSVRTLKQLALLALSLHGGLFRFYWFCLTTCIKHALDVYVFVCKVSYQNFVSKASRSELKFDMIVYTSIHFLVVKKDSNISWKGCCHGEIRLSGLSRANDFPGLS